MNETTSGLDATKQLNVAIDARLRDRFAAAATERRQSQRQIVETLLEAWVVAQEGTGQRHLDGSECPLSVFLRDLKDSVTQWSATCAHQHNPSRQ